MEEICFYFLIYYYLNMTTLTIPLSKKEKERLKSAALRYGFSPDELSRRIIADATQILFEIPEESLDEYDNADEIKESLYGALKDERKGRIFKSLPKHLYPRK